MIAVTTLTKPAADAENFSYLKRGRHDRALKPITARGIKYLPYIPSHENAPGGFHVKYITKSIPSKVAKHPAIIKNLCHQKILILPDNPPIISISP